ncbi:MAG: 4Fe-4S binding protein, partial [Candidatus Poribacteria bacterium]
MQIARRATQILVLAFLVLVPMVNYYGVKVQQQDYRGIERSAMLSTVARVFGEMDRNEAADLSHKVKGSVWTADVFGHKISDPLAAIESTTTSARLHWPLIVSIALPALVALIFGRVYCGWMCPMNLVFEINDKLRTLLKKTGYNVRDVRFGRQTKYVVLGVGLLVAFIVGLPVLSLMYPPAIMSREVFYRVYGGAF